MTVLIKLKNKKNYTYIFACILVAVSFLAAVKFLSQVIVEHYDSERIVCLDAGHGGSDSGATSTDGKRLEKDDNLNLTLKVRDELKAMGIEVILTREDDSEVTLKERCRLANKKRCALFVSLHRNSSATGTGFEAWISRNEKDGEKQIAENLLEKLSETSSLGNRGVKRGFRDLTARNYYINANTNMPSILLEVSFITSEEDNKCFDRDIDEYAKAIAQVIANSI